MQPFLYKLHLYSDFENMTDEQLIAGCSKNDINAQTQLYNRFARRMMGICLRYSENRTEAQDFLQDGFLKVFKKISTFKGEGTLDGWIRKIMINTALDHIRRKDNEKNRVEFEEETLWNGDDDGILPAISAKELLKHIQNLPCGYRTAFNLFAIEGYSHKEISDMLGVTENTSKTQYHRARLHLQKTIQYENKLVSEHE